MRACGQCGTTLGAYGPAGLCPRCMLLDGLGDDPVRRFGDYELIGEIARGGMGVVWKARQISLNRTVAVKLMLSGAFAQPEHVRRFRTEAEAAASLQHPNIVAIHEIGEHERQPFFSMDYVEGQNLAQLVRDRPLAPRRAAAYLRTIAEALRYAHEHQILHRDLKPSNILIDGADQPRITDFGLAKRLSSDTDLTLSGQVLGSPNYLPPEQAEARHDQVGPASDVYSLGAVLYWLLTARAPFQAATVADTLRQVSQADPVSPRLLNPSVPKDLETICLKCLEKDIPRRYPSAQALAEELGRFLRDEPIQARAAGGLEKGWRWCRRKPIVAGLAAALALVFSIGFAGVLWQWRRAQAGEASARRSLYTADINLAMRAHEENNRGRTLELLGRHRPRSGEEDLRGWEWRYLWRECRGGERLTLGEFPGAVTWVTFSRDSQLLAAGDVSGVLRVWKMPAAQRVLEAQIDGGINSLAFSPDGTQLLMAHYYQRGVDLWSLSERRTVATLRPQSDQWPHHMAAFSPDGNRIAIVNDDGRFEVWDAHARTNLFSQPGDKTCVAGIEWSPDGRWIASGDQRNLLTVRDAFSYEIRWEQPCQFGMPLKTFAFSPDGQLVTAAANDRSVRVWNISNGQLAARLTNHTAWIRAVTFAEDGKRLVTASGDQTIRLWDTATWQAAAVLRGHDDEVHALALSADGRWLASGSKDGVVKLWDATPPREPSSTRMFQVQTGEVPVGPAMAGDKALGTALAPDGKSFLVWRAAGAVEIWDALTLTLQRIARLEAQPLGKDPVVAVAGGGATVVFGGEDGVLRAFRPSIESDSPETTPLRARPLWTNSILDTIAAPSATNAAAENKGTAFSRVVFSNDGSVLATSSEDHTVRVWEAATGRLRARFDGQCRWHFALAISPDGSRVAAGNENRIIRWWRLPEGTLGGELREPRLMHVRGLAFSPDGNLLASASLDNRVRLWDLRRNALVRTFSRTLLSFRAVTFSPDGRRILAGTAAEGQIQLWNVADGQEFGTLKTQAGPVTRLVFADPDTLVSLVGGEVRLWLAASERELDLAGTAPR